MYLVERHLPGISLPELAALLRAGERACQAAIDRGEPVRYVRSTFAPGESRCHCLFEARHADVVEEINDLAQIPYSRIMLAVELPATEPPTGARNVAAHADPQRDESQEKQRRRRG